MFIGRDPATGRRIDRSVTVRGNRADAERELAAMVAAAEAERGRRGALAGERAAGGVVRGRLDRVGADHDPPDPLGARPLPPPTPRTARGRRGDAGDDRRHLRHAAPLRGSRAADRWRPGTLTRIHVVLRAAFAQAMRWGWIWDNPAERAHRIVHVSAELRPPTPAELRTLLDHVADRDPQLHALLMLAAFTGARRAQLLGLRWHNVHLAARRVSFSAGWVEGPDGPVLTATKTKRRHVVDLDPATFDVLADLAAERGCAATPGGFVFSDDGGPRRGSRTGSPRRSCATAAPPGCGRSGCTTCATSWPPRCSTPASRSSSSPAASTTGASRPRSTSTPTPSPAATPTPPPPSGRSCKQPGEANSRVVERVVDAPR